MNKKNMKYISYAVLGIVAVMSVFQIATGSIATAEASGCTSNPEQDLRGEITSAGTVRISNTSTNCSYAIGVASYKKFNENIDDQVLFDSETKTIAPKQTLTLTIDVPACAYQIDAFYGELITSFKNGKRYSTRLLDWTHEGGTNYCSNTPTIPSPTVTTSCTAIAISWSKANQGTGGYTVDITNESSFDNGGWHKVVTDSDTPTSLTISNFDGFAGFSGKTGNLAFERGKTYKLRIYYRSTGKHSPVISFTVPNNCGTVDTLDASCAVTPSTVNVNENVQWSGWSTGGTYSYSYLWTGDDGLTGTERVVTKSYSTPGVKHATFRVSSGGQTITKNCQITVNQPTSSNFTSSCSVSPSTVNTNQTVTWSASASGGTGSYTYSWSGDNVSGSSNTVTSSYSTTGVKQAQVIIRSGNESHTRMCQVTVSQPSSGSFDGSCAVTPSSGHIGDTFFFTTSASGGNGSYSYSWNGDDVSGSGSTLNQRFTSNGTKNVTVTITSGGNSISRTCSVSIVPHSGNGGGGYITPPPYYNPPVVGGVYLSDVPYTGIGSNIKIALFILALLAWSAGIAYLLVRRRAGKAGKTVAELMNATAGNKPVTGIPTYRTIPVLHSVPTSGITLKEYIPNVQSPRPVAQTTPAVFTIPRFDTGMEHNTSIHQSQSDIVSALESRAHELTTLVSADGLEVIAQASQGNKHTALITLNHLVELYKTEQHQKDGEWLVLGGEKISNVLFSEPQVMTPMFLQWLAEGDENKSLAYMRMMQIQGQSVGNFVSNLVLELDRAHKQRVANMEGANANILGLTKTWSDSELEGIISSLMNAVDDTYKSVYSSVKIAVMEILSMAKAKKQAYV